MNWTAYDLRRVVDYLRQKTDIFKEVRRKFNIGEELGLIIFPAYHDFSPAFINYCVVERGSIYACRFSEIPRTSWVVSRGRKISEEQIILRPVCKNNEGYFVSIYFSPGVMENIKGINLDESFFQASDDVIKGIIAHECAEYILHVNKRLFPLRLRIALKMKMAIALPYFLTFPRDIRSQLKKQCPADLLVSLFGYKTEVLAFLNFERERLLRQENFSFNDNFRSPRELAEEVQVRLDFIR